MIEVSLAKVPSRCLNELIDSGQYLFHITDVKGFVNILSSGYIKPLTHSGDDGRKVATSSFTEDPIALIEEEPLTFADIANPKDFILIFPKKFLKDSGVKPVKYLSKKSPNYDVNNYFVMLEDYDVEREWRSLNEVCIKNSAVSYTVVDYEYTAHDVGVTVI